MIVVVAACIYSLAFQLLFYSTPLYNSASNADERIVRAQLLTLAFAAGDPASPSWLELTASRLTGFTDWGLRARIASLAFSTWLVAWMLGSGVRRAAFAGLSVRRMEALVIDAGLGAGLLSLFILGIGLAGRAHWTAFAILGFAIFAFYVACRISASGPRSEAGESTADSVGKVGVIAGAAVASIPFAAIAFLAAMLPTTDYDALGYHLLGPKEWFLRGKIEFLGHNVYTTFPFLTEMFAYAAMAMFDDWFAGGLAGQAFLSGFGPLTAMAVGLLTARWFGAIAGCFAALIYVTTPWTYRLSSIPYVEGALNFYACAAMLAGCRADQSVRWSALSGCLAGCAVGCKYTGVVFAGAPALLVCVARSTDRRFSAGLAFSLGAMLTAGPWLLRNAVWTGNPTYPLLSSVFKTRNWDHDKAARFSEAHRSRSYSMVDLVEHASIVAVRSDWQTPLAFGLAPIALAGLNRRRAAVFAAWALGIFGAFWLLTHRLDRFFLTIQIPLSALAGAGFAWTTARTWRWFAAASMLLSLIYHFVYCTSGLCGLPNYSANLQAQRRSNWRLEPAVQLANNAGLVHPSAGVLFVGYAAVYNAIPRAMYNTVFDDNVLEQIARNPDAEQPNAIRPGFRILAALDALEIDVVIVDWSWIDRYREPGNYGYSDFVRPELFRQLTQAGVLEPLASTHEAAPPHVRAFRVLRHKRPEPRE